MTAYGYADLETYCAELSQDDVSTTAHIRYNPLGATALDETVCNIYLIPVPKTVEHVQVTLECVEELEQHDRIIDLRW